jgi:hypothetical protein
MNLAYATESTEGRVATEGKDDPLNREGPGPNFRKAQRTLASGADGLLGETQPIVTPQNASYNGPMAIDT